MHQRDLRGDPVRLLAGPDLKRRVLGGVPDTGLP